MRKNKLGKISLLVISLLLCACAATTLPTQSLPKPKGKNAVLILYRMTGVTDLNTTYYVTVDKKGYGTLANGATKIIYLPAGKHQIKINVSEFRHPVVKKIILQSNRYYFLKLSTMAAVGSMDAEYILQTVNQTNAMNELGMKP